MENPSVIDLFVDIRPHGSPLIRILRTGFRLILINVAIEFRNLNETHLAVVFI